MSEIRTCYRCGVDFDASLFIPDAPCEDCNLDVPGRWLRGWSKGTTTEEKEADIRELYAKHLSDPQIAKYLGISPQTVLRWRHKLELPGYTDLGGSTSWAGDTSEVARAASRAYWDNPNRKPRGGGRAPAVSGPLTNPALREVRDQVYREKYVNGAGFSRADGYNPRSSLGIDVENKNWR